MAKTSEDPTSRGISLDHIEQREFPHNVIPFPKLERDDPDYEAKKKSNIFLELTHKLFRDGIPFPKLRRGDPNFETRQRLNMVVEILIELQELNAEMKPVSPEKKVHKANSKI